MRIYLKLTKSRQLIPFNYQPFLVGALHKWLGVKNLVHDTISLYSFSWLQNVEIQPNGVKATPESYFFISAYDEELLKRIVKGVMADPAVCFGVNVAEVQLADAPNFTKKQYFYTASPVFIKRPSEEGEKHFTYDDAEAGKWLTETLQTKLRRAGLSEEGVNVSFDNSFLSPKTKIISYKKIRNRVSICPVIIEGTPEQIAFAWNVGIGNSTGIGFGALK